MVLASKKSSRTAAEGFLALAQNERKAALIELNCETDFVARNEIFQYLALSLAKSALCVEGSQLASGTLPFGPEYLEDVKLSLDHPKLNGEKTVQNAITELAAMMGENVKLRRGFAIAHPTQGVMSTYLHTSPQQGIGRIAGILSLEVEDANTPLDAVQRIGSELAMHVVAAKPLFLTKEDVSSDALDNEREILKSQAESTAKSSMAIEKMVEGRLRKYYEDVVFLEQKFVVNDKLNVKTLLSNLSKEVGSPVKIGSFLRVEVGEGLQGLVKMLLLTGSAKWSRRFWYGPTPVTKPWMKYPRMANIANLPFFTSFSFKSFIDFSSFPNPRGLKRGPPGYAGSPEPPKPFSSPRKYCFPIEPGFAQSWNLRCSANPMRAISRTNRV
nr:elongation factor Ts, mitochondrial [Ipomoea batatas]